MRTAIGRSQDFLASLASGMRARQKSDMDTWRKRMYAGEGKEREVVAIKLSGGKN